MQSPSPSTADEAWYQYWPYACAVDDTQHVEIFHRLPWFTDTALALMVPGMYVVREGLQACKVFYCKISVVSDTI